MRISITNIYSRVIMPSDLNTDVTLPLDKTRNRPAAKAIESPQNLNCVFQKDNTVEPKMTPAAQVWKGYVGGISLFKPSTGIMLNYCILSLNR